MTSAESYPYPAREHYDFPKVPSEVLKSEYELYGSREDTLRMMIGLRNMYKATGFMKSMLRYSEFALAAKSNDSDVVTHSKINSEFYAGTLLATHATVSVQQTWQKSFILGRGFLVGLTDDNPAKAAIESRTTEWLKVWIGDEEHGWSDFFSKTSEPYQRVSTAFAERIYPNSDESQLHFMAGMAHATNLLSQITIKNGPRL